MSRQARVVAEGVPHHVTQRGNNRQNIFLTADDRRFYIDLLRDRSAQFGVSILGYCLMTSHIHLIAIPRCPDSLAKALGQTIGAAPSASIVSTAAADTSGRTSSIPVRSAPLTQPTGTNR